MKARKMWYGKNINSKKTSKTNIIPLYEAVR